MPEYVYALHDFAPEHDDEIAFKAGERIEVIEKDDLYGDGWWQGRNLQGKVGLFPQSYAAAASTALTAATPQATASTSAPLQTLKEESDVDSVPSTVHDEAKGENGGVMRATMTDVQKAIEQLGGHDRDGGASFSFASYREGDITDRETDRETDTETDKDADNDTWHKGTRHSLAEKARAAAEHEKLRQVTYRANMPPIDVEVSDESDVEDDQAISPVKRDHPRIAEEEESSEIAESPLLAPPAAIKTPTHSRAASASAITPDLQATLTPDPYPSPTKSDSQMSTAKLGTFIIPPQPQPQLQVSTPLTPVEPVAPIPVVAPTPLSTLSSPWSPTPTNNENDASALSPIHESDAISPTQSAPTPSSLSNATRFAPRGPPSEWTVEDVVEWARSKNFDNSICAKFIEHEITGDVLLDLDATLLKTELEIHAFGKRTRIAHAIDELRRPPSIISSEHRSVPSHSVSHSQSLPSSAHQSFASTLAHQNGVGAGQLFSPESPPHTGDLAGTPVSVPQYRRESDPGSTNVDITDSDQISQPTLPSVGLGLVTSNGSLDPEKARKGKPLQLNLSPSPSESALKVKAVGGLIEGESEEARVLEDKGALSESETAHGSDSRSKRRRLFGRSTGSTNSSHDPRDSVSRNSKETGTPQTSLPGSPSVAKGGSPLNEDSASVRHARPPKRSVDASKPTDRLSLFGSSFVGSIGKSRKPPPRYSSYVAEDAPVEKSRGLTRLMGSHGSKKSSGRPSTADATNRKHSAGSFGFLDHGDKEKDKDKGIDHQEVAKGNEKTKSKENGNGKEKEKVKEPAQLRKRTVSQTKDAEKTLVGDVVLTPGENVLDQIGTPDHNGWMRKKGEQFNTWKLRYFILKGPHLYYLRSNSKTESKIKGYINITGYKVIVDENVDPGRYGFRLIHDTEKTHYLSSDEQTTVREWMKALMKATIGRDYTKPVISSANVPTIPLSVAQTMIPAPRPPSPTARDATQKALRRENPNQLSSRDARVLMGLPSPEIEEKDPERARLESFFTVDAVPLSLDLSEQLTAAPTPPRPKERRISSNFARVEAPAVTHHMESELMNWANNHLPESLKLKDTSGVYSGLALFRLAEAIKGTQVEPHVPDNAFPSSLSDDRLDGLFKLFDFFLDNDIKMGNVSINDVRQGNADKIEQLVRSLKTWEEKRKAIALTIAKGGAHTGPFMAVEKDPAWKL